MVPLSSAPPVGRNPIEIAVGGPQSAGLGKRAVAAVKAMQRGQGTAGGVILNAVPEAPVPPTSVVP